MIVEVALNVLEEELDLTPWVELGLREFEEYLAKQARFDLWLVQHGRA